jgi:hypothetical protein
MKSETKQELLWVVAYFSLFFYYWPKAFIGLFFDKEQRQLAFSKNN